VPTMRLDDLGKSTTLESNKSLLQNCGNPNSPYPRRTAHSRMSGYAISPPTSPFPMTHHACPHRRHSRARYAMRTAPNQPSCPRPAWAPACNEPTLPHFTVQPLPARPNNSPGERVLGATPAETSRHTRGDRNG
jgi:hypothetical protein